ncbi:hypothetical protein KCL46_000716 [Clostridium perfringens]|nr:hypothetical protein [Clostridium perfringens]
MLKVTFLELLVRGIPEAFLMVLAAYCFANKKVNRKNYVVSSLIIALVVYLVRFLPISYGVHTILNVFVLIFLIFNINKIDLIASIRASILILMILFVCEGLNIWFVQYVLNKNLSDLFKNSLDKVIFGTPSTVIFGTIVILYYLIASKKGKLR